MRLRGIRSRRRPSRGGASRGVGRAAGARRRSPGSGRPGRRYAGLKAQASRGTAGPRGSRRVRGRRRMKKRGCP